MIEFLLNKKLVVHALVWTTIHVKYTVHDVIISVISPLNMQNPNMDPPTTFTTWLMANHSLDLKIVIYTS
jgi:hypothetical protein